MHIVQTPYQTKAGALNRHAPIAVSLVASMAAFILVTLALFSGKQPGFMEDADIITVWHLTSCNS